MNAFDPDGPARQDPLGRRHSEEEVPGRFEPRSGWLNERGHGSEADAGQASPRDDPLWWGNALRTLGSVRPGVLGVDATLQVRGARRPDAFFNPAIG